MTTSVHCDACGEVFGPLDIIRSCRLEGFAYHDRCSCPMCESCKFVEIEPKRQSVESEIENEELKIESSEPQIEEANSLGDQQEESLAESLFQQRIKAYEEQIKDLKKQNQNLQKDLESKVIEINRLEEAANAASIPQGTQVSQEEINVLNEKLKQMSLELQKEIRNSTTLTVDKMKLQSMLEQATKSLKAAKELNQQTAQLERKVELETVEYISLRQAKNKNGCAQSVIIRNVKGAFFNTFSVMDYIGKLMRLMNANLSTLDVEKVSVMEGKRCGETSMIVKFKSLSSKVHFLTKSSVLRATANTRDLVLHEFVDDNTNTLYHEAKSLRNLGYKYVYCRDNKVNVKKDENSVPIVIEKREDIESLKTKKAACSSFFDLQIL